MLMVITDYRLDLLTDILYKDSSNTVFKNEAKSLRIMAFNDFMIYINFMGTEEARKALKRAYTINAFADFIDYENKISLWTLYSEVFKDLIEQEMKELEKSSV